MTYGRECDGSLKLSMRAGKDAVETRSDGALRQAWQKVKETTEANASSEMPTLDSGPGERDNAESFKT